MRREQVFIVTAIALAPAAALASAPVPVPLAGSLGPAGLVVAAAAYVGYRFWKRNRD